MQRRTIENKSYEILIKSWDMAQPIKFGSTSGRKACFGEELENKSKIFVKDAQNVHIGIWTWQLMRTKFWHLKELSASWRLI